MTKRQAARVAKAERMVRDAIALLDSVNVELKAEFTASALTERSRVVRLAGALERAVGE